MRPITPPSAGGSQPTSSPAIPRPVTPPLIGDHYARVVPDTPSVAKKAHEPEFFLENLEKQRLSLLEDNEKAVLVSPEYFLNTHAPRVNDQDVSMVVSKLVAAGLIVNGRWRDFPQDPAKSSETEARTFMPLVDIAKAVADFGAASGKTSLVQFESNPNSTPRSIDRNDLSRPDGYFILRVRNGTRWRDIAVTAEFKLRAGYGEILDVSVRFDA